MKISQLRLDLFHQEYLRGLVFFTQNVLDSSFITLVMFLSLRGKSVRFRDMVSILSRTVSFHLGVSLSSID